VAVLAYPVNAASPSEDGLTAAGWALVYWDDVALVYLRRGKHLEAAIQRDEYLHVKPAYGVQYLLQTLADTRGAPAVEAEIRRNVAATGSSVGHTFLGFARITAGAHDQAIDSFERVQNVGSPWDKYQGLAMAHWRKGDLATAIEYYRAIVSVVPTPVMLYNLGLALAQAGNDREAVDYLERARAADGAFLPVYAALMGASRRLGQTHREGELAQGHATALTLNRAAQHFGKAVRLQETGRPAEAISELQASLRLDPRNAQALSRLGDLYFHQGKLDDAVAQQRRALAIEPQLAMAHYGLGLVHRRRGELADARRHLQEYVRLAPRSHLAWEAREELAKMSR
jgi:tetratricopeptide (TPR) repeat protein